MQDVFLFRDAARIVSSPLRSIQKSPDSGCPRSGGGCLQRRHRHPPSAYGRYMEIRRAAVFPVAFSFEQTKVLLEPC